MIFRLGFDSASLEKHFLVNKIRYYLQNKTMVPYQRSKLMFTGAGRGGKTSTINSLLGYKFKKTKSTIVATADIDLKIILKDVVEDTWKEHIPGEGQHLIQNEFSQFLGLVHRNPRIET